ncbi:MAG: JAB domain-containing protein [Bacteroidetes bacterium]|nr:JAB domain-containing protein [Bacteroidota bacterium]
METVMIRNENFYVTEVELIYKSKVKPSTRPKIKNSKDAYEIFYQTWDKNKIELQEQFKVMLLNRANKVLGIYEMSTGGITGTVADPKLIYAVVLKSSAVNIILAHNHPSGSLDPSKADLELTSKISEAGKYFDIKVLDHIIISEEGYHSFADSGEL